MMPDADRFPPRGSLAQDHVHDFGLNQSKVMNVIDSKSSERDRQISLRNLRKLDCVGKPVPTFPHPALLPRRLAHLLIRAYQLSLSAFIGRRCRYLPTCSDYTDEAITRHGLWAGGFMGLARLCRCHPWGGSGYDPVPARLAPGAHWAQPWRYGQWRQRPTCETVDGKTDRTER
jgi:putative membrane protein insertion efficiency factor